MHRASMKFTIAGCKGLLTVPSCQACLVVASWPGAQPTGRAKKTEPAGLTGMQTNLSMMALYHSRSHTHQQELSATHN